MRNWLNTTHVGDCHALLAEMAADGVQVQTCVTSPPYFGLRDYGHAGQIGLEPTPAEYVEQLVAVFRMVRAVLADDGTLWLNLGDSYAGGGGFCASAPSSETSKSGKYGSSGAAMKSAGKVAGLKAKDLIGIPWRVALALQADGWYLRSDIIWSKPNVMPESVTDRPTKAHEYLFLLAKAERYYYDSEAIKEADSGAPSGNGFVGRQGGSERYGKALENVGSPGTQERWQPGGGRNRRSVWTINTQPFSGAHFATFPRALIEPCILAGCQAGGTVLDPFMGSGTTGQVATDLGRNFIGCELNPKYVELHEMRRTTIGMAI